MKLKTFFKIVIVNIVLFAIATVFVIYEIESLRSENQHLVDRVENLQKEADLKLIAECEAEKVVVYDVDSLQKSLDTATEQVLEGAH